MKNNLGILLLMSLTAISCGPKKDYLVTIKTSYGEIQAILFEDTPLHKANFLKLAREGRYDGTSFHRVIKEFMIQGGDVNAKEGTTSSPEALIPAEIHAHNIHVKGALAAARNNNPQKKSSECQFYIVQGRTYTKEELTLDRVKINQYFGRFMELPENQSLREEIIALQTAQDIPALEAKLAELRPLIENEFKVSLEKEVPAKRLEAYTEEGGAPHLDDEYTVFGQVISGLEVVDAIAAQPTGVGDKPLEEIAMTVEIHEMKRNKITKLYGYQYPDEK